MASNEFVVRNRQSGPTPDLRVYIHPDQMNNLGLKLGDLCEIRSEEHGLLGYGFAWRDADKMGGSPKVAPAKMTETLRSTYGIEEGSTISLSRTDAKRMHAEKVILRDFTSNGEDLDDDRWVSRCAATLFHLEGFASGMTFNVTAKKDQFRPTDVTKRFFVEHVESEAQKGSTSLFYIGDRTEISINNTGQSSRPCIEASYALSQQYIGGLLDQVRAINRNLELLIRNTRESKHVAVNEGILIHGFEGTGKSLILRRMEHGKWRALRLEKSTLDAATIAKNKDIITRIFSDAKRHQPSLVLMDNIDELAPTTNGPYTSIIAEELRKAIGSGVMVVGACRNPTDVNSTIVGPDGLCESIELPIPDQAAREQILNVLMDDTFDPQGALAGMISPRTHGFTGKDLALLVQIGIKKGLIRSLGTQDGHRSQPNGFILSDSNGDISPKASAFEDFEYALSKIKPTALREIFFEKPNVGWENIGGSRDNKHHFDEIIGWPLFHADVLALHRINPKKGVLLYGPPGCSKTLTAQAIATNYNLNFIAIKGAELLSMYVGESERAVREVFRKARAAAPCVIFFDEIDSIAAERESTKGLNVLTTLLNEMDGFDSLKRVLVLAATNKPEILDPAIMRPGRFDRHIYLGPPNAVARREIFELSTKGLTFEEDFNFEPLITATQGYSGAEIVHICGLAKDEVVRRALQEAQPTVPVTLQYFNSAIDRTTRGITQEMIDGYEAFGRKV